MPLTGTESDSICNLVGMLQISQEKAKKLYVALNEAGLLEDASQALISLVMPTNNEMQLQESTNCELDLMKLAILPPSQWKVSLCEGGVVIGAWIWPYRKEGVFSPSLYKRFFKFKNLS